MKKALTVAGAVALAAGAATSVIPTSAAAQPSAARKVVARSVASPGKVIGSPSASAASTFIVTLQPRNAAGLQSFVRAVSDPSSPSYRKFITPGQYAARYSATSAEVAQVTAWLRSQGLKPGKVSPTRTFITVSGSTSAVQKAFATKIHSYKTGARTFTAPATSVTVPANLAGSIAGVVGLDQSRLLHTTNVRPDTTSKKATPNLKSLGATTSAKSGTSDACSAYYGQYTLPYIPAGKAPLNKKLPGSMCGYTPQQMQAARGINKVKSTGKGMKVGITLWCNDPRIFNDTNTWAGDLHYQKLKSSQYQVLAPAGGYNSDYCDNTDSGGVNVEQALDVQSIHGAAPDAKIVYSAASAPLDDSLLTALHALVDNNSVDVITDSWGGSETNDAATNDAYSSVFMQAAAQGIPVLFSSGDEGDNTNGNQKVTPPSPDYPAANPWVTAVGGTSLGTSNVSGSKVGWEQAWNTERSVRTNDSWGSWTYRYGGGGGTSDYHPQPYYQKGVVPTRFAGVDPHRVYPDLAGAADPYTGYLIGYHDGSTASGDFTLGKIGGTSWSSPWTAGTLALAGKRLGFLNPIIYGAGHAGLTDIKGNQLTHGFELKANFVDKTTGAIYQALTTVSVNSQNLEDQTLTSDKGYDNLTGFGVPTSTKVFLAALLK
ncbi:protease pro-enzyme activation domain-containing protein [Allobranchiibius sp. GilTou73]|uniref:S53 family peptidase n=1 Tax=Allobranchiibius sp. GilTou73 TaxID=2904523 RepID=UPI001F486027|nr:S53 family peptidase [Allobranchiibius sp. GilTou73]UIJ35713.1 S53 family peptidase [Allobranchiibius sp. GilTou73]